MCNKPFTPSSSRNRTTILLIWTVVPVLAVALLVLSYVIWRQKIKPQISTQDPPREPELVAPGSEKGHGDQLKNTENRRFTYKELEKFTNKFERFIEQGGFGMVYYGCLEDNTEVAIEMRSESSSHGLDEFLAEKDHLALVYEYMYRGNLCDHLTGLDYLHKGCSLPIIHGDVKTSNILLGQNLQAEIADFGLCKTYLSDTQTNRSTVATGTAGYIEPEYSRDVYSFGVVLPEIVTGERPVLSNHGHIVQRVKRKIAAGKISPVNDGRLGDTYDVSSMWKVVDTANNGRCGGTLVQLRASLALEEVREDSGVGGSFASTVALVSTVGPSAR
ncbi:hypothetical protein BRADI_4g28531v3 [Brachypodium distachyon]|uniref:Protein kinase domain-containing protein n=1 Tax=Brachypodium distachyon TaxID=15368 RepID=A0A0Q3H9E5_BRADI|nr:hypothetical protein BRADI_4g28531v3 [Brachypodium distachyon]